MLHVLTLPQILVSTSHFSNVLKQLQTSVVVQRLRIHLLMAWDTGLVPGLGRFHMPLAEAGETLPTVIKTQSSQNK